MVNVTEKPILKVLRNLKAVSKNYVCAHSTLTYLVTYLKLRVYFLGHFLSVCFKKFNSLFERLKHFIGDCLSVLYSHKMPHYSH